jgi:hypothetical protein
MISLFLREAEWAGDDDFECSAVEFSGLLENPALRSS